MIVFHGTRFYGKVDQVPGLFCVATQFFYLQFIPLFPVGSYLLLEGPRDGNGNYQGCKIGLSLKSILFAWGRCLGILGCIVLGSIAIIQLVEALDGVNPGGAMKAANFAGATIALALITLLSWRLSHASPTRALALARQMNIAPEHVAQFFVAKLKPADEEALAQQHLSTPVVSEVEAPDRETA